MVNQTENKRGVSGVQFLVAQPVSGPRTFIEASSQKEVERITKEFEESGQKIVMSTTSKQDAIDKVNETPSVNVIRGLQGSSM